jgi:DNA-directed RNA polymerase II subunit RPB2
MVRLQLFTNLHPPLFYCRCCCMQSDRDILEHIVYDFGDHEMMEALRPSIEEAQPINSQQLALDYIGKRASQVRYVLLGLACEGL